MPICRLRSPVLSLAVGALATGCLGGEPGPPGDGPDDRFLSGGKSDGLVDLSRAERLGLLRLVNEASLKLLARPAADGGVGLAPEAAESIVNHRLDAVGTRAQEDGVEPGEAGDAMIIGSLEELDGISFVGPRAFQQLLEFARAEGYVLDVPPACEPQLDDLLALGDGMIARMVRDFTQGGELTAGDWQWMRDQIVRLPPTASAEARALLSLWRQPDLSIPHEVERDLARILQSRLGYRVPAERPAHDRALALAIRGNVTETDWTFRCLTGLAERRVDTALVAVLDSDTYPDHVALASSLWRNPGETPDSGFDNDGNGLVDDVHGWDFLEERPQLYDNLPSADHGTHVGAIAAAGSDRVQVLLGRISSGTFTSEMDGAHIARAIEYSAVNGARVVNLSQFITESTFAAVVAAIEEHPDVLFVLAAGNSGEHITSTDQSQILVAERQLEHVVVVGAHDAAGGLADYSVYGAPLVNVAARGDVVSAIPPTLENGARYGIAEGTSQATPNVANVAAKASVLAPSLTAADLKTLLVLSSAEEPAWTDLVEAGGPLQPRRALELAALAELVASGLSRHEAAYELLLRGEDRRVLFPRLDALAVQSPALQEPSDRSW